ncbi:hypothetical protein HMSSN139_58470 [Paenibacillus sp. HMSSN-139]|nr:hypothetical protein HMSSN139_58470 [Paenibacillus sp. HMSSN-139]
MNKASASRKALRSPKVLRMRWQPLPVHSEGRAELAATLIHDGQPVHELRLHYRILSANLRSRSFPLTGRWFIGGRRGL